jgi:hypothetical protein
MMSAAAEEADAAIGERASERFAVRYTPVIRHVYTDTPETPYTCMTYLTRNARSVAERVEKMSSASGVSAPVEMRTKISAHAERNAKVGGKANKLKRRSTVASMTTLTE